MSLPGSPKVGLQRVKIGAVDGKTGATWPGFWLQAVSVQEFM